MPKSDLHLKILPRDKRWLKLFVMAEALGPPPTVTTHREHAKRRTRAGRQLEESKL